MTKKNYIVIGVTILIFLGIIVLILINKQNSNWTKDILNTNNYNIYYIDCNKVDISLCFYLFSSY